MSHHVPDIRTFREFVDHMPDACARYIAMLLYLTGARASEVCTTISKYDEQHQRSKPYGQYLQERIADYQNDKVLLIELATAKKKRVPKKAEYVPRIIALPTDPVYEPWTKPLLQRIVKRGTLRLDVTPSRIYQIVTANMRELDASIHPHALRSYRVTHLGLHYEFTPYDLVSFAGWSLKNAFGYAGLPVASSMRYYLNLSWQMYYPKLPKNLFNIMYS
jgi:integrase